MMTKYGRSRLGLTWMRVLHQTVEHMGYSRLEPALVWLVNHRPLFWVVPTAPIRMMRHLKSPATPWTRPVPDVPDALRTQPGIRKDAALEAAADAAQPLWSFQYMHGTTYKRAMRGMWLSMLKTAPWNARALRRRMALPAVSPVAVQAVPGREQLTRELREFAAELGLSALGITCYQEKYNFAEFRGRHVGQTVIVGILEQNFDSTQLIPSVRSESAALATYGQLERRMVRLAEWLNERGFTARPEGHVGESLSIAYAVEAGLGQLGLNGQLLTPHAGSRARLHVMTTDADLDLDEPVDYGLEGVCNNCRICVERCPAGAITQVRQEHRGVTKAKLNTKRCLPVLGMASGCAVCMKTCPVQRYGLPAVIDEFERSGQILGKGTDDLEGFDWPVDGKHYGPGEKPRIRKESFAIIPEFDPYRTVPVTKAKDAETAADASRSFEAGLS